MTIEDVIRHLLTPTGLVWRGARADNDHTRASGMTSVVPVLVPRTISFILALFKIAMLLVVI